MKKPCHFETAILCKTIYFIWMNFLSFIRLPTVITYLVLSFQEAKANLKLLVAKQLDIFFFFFLLHQ